MAYQTDVDLLMIGKTGMGKSALGNGILRRKKFLSMSSTSSITAELEYEVTDYKGKIIKVVDGPGVGDTRLDKKASVDLVSDKMAQAMLINPRGYHAFLLVTRYGARFTDEDRDTVTFLKNLFGPQFVRKYCILVMTCGDLFERDSEEVPGLTFPVWCRNQTGVFQELMQECCHRIVLFDNVTRDEAKLDTQLDNLLEMVSNLQSQGHRYTDESFQKAGVLREKALVESKRPVIQEETLQEVSLILQKLNEEKISFRHDLPVTALQELVERCDRLIQHLREQDRQTGALADLEEKVKAVKQSVENAISAHTAATEERRRMQERENLLREQMDGEIQRRRDQMDEIKEEMSRSIERQRQQYEEVMRQGELDRGDMEREFHRRRQEIEAESRQRLERAERELEEQRRRNEEIVESRHRADMVDLEQRLVVFQQQMADQAQRLDTTYRETKKTSAAEVMMKGMGYFALAAGHVIAPELMAVLWLSASMYAAYANQSPNNA